MKEYGIQLREKQKVKRLYSVMEKQFRGYFKAADRAKGVTGENLLLLLETRFDNVVHIMGFAPSKAQARQMIRHNHFTVNGKKMNIPSYKTRAGDIVKVREKSIKSPFIMASLESKSDDQIPEWLTVDRGAMSGSVVSAPMRDSIQMPINEQLIVELYSK
jgi:small subunit ribosomal protein S4